MNLGSLTTIGKLKPKNLVHLVFDNQRHESTGGQPSNTKNIDLYEISKSSNYNAFKANSKTDLKKIFRRIKEWHFGVFQHNRRTGQIVMPSLSS